MKNLRKPVAACLGLILAGNVFGAAGTAPNMDSTLNPAEFDKNTSACQNLFAFVNTSWIAAHPIPGDRTSWGSFEMLAERSLNAQHDIVEALAKANSAAGSIEQKVGDFYATGMDEASIEKAGYAPIKDDLKRID